MMHRRDIPAQAVRAAALLAVTLTVFAGDAFAHGVADGDGMHGWYWRNGGETSVSIELTIAGFYTDLFEPPAE